MRSLFVRVVSHRSGWIFRDLDLLIRRWGNIVCYHLLWSGFFIFL
jgi:hypothetical protein